MNRSPFQLAAPLLRSRGYSVIPLAPNSKYPVITGWADFGARQSSDEEFTRWMDWKAANIGLCLGTASGVMALDFDDDIDGLHAKIIAMLSDSPVKKRGAKGFTAFYRYSGERSHAYGVDQTHIDPQTGEITKKTVRVLDVLNQGRQTVLPPSSHPDGGSYRWLTVRTLADIAPDELPEIPTETMRAISRLFRAEPERPVRNTYAEPYRETGIHDIREALSYIPADDYDVWIRMGMALRQQLGDAGLALWDAWSGTSTKYDAHGIQKKWGSFRRSDITIASLFYTAMDYGYIPQHRLPDRPQPPLIVIEPGGNLMPVSPKPQAVAEPRPVIVPPSEILNPPGLVGRIAGWINDTSIYPQPMLAVAAAITAAGAAMSHKVQSPTRLRTNFYTMGLAPSGAGKDHARDCVTTLLCQSGLQDVLGGIPASGAGMLTALHEGGGRCLILWDEFGRVLKNLTHKNAGSHQRDILTYLVELFSSAKSMYAGVQYANHDGKMKRTPIEQPCLSVYATTVPERFFQAMTSDDAIDGFLARWLVLESTDYTLQPSRPKGEVNDPPEAILAELRRWKDAPSNYDPRGNIDGVLRICPMTVSYCPEAEKLIGEYSEEMRRRAAEESKARSGLSAIYARCAEHAIKLALAAHEGESIGVDAIRWGIAVADYCATYMVQAIRLNVAENDHERALNAVLRAIKDTNGDWVDTKTLINRTRTMKARDRNDIIASLIEMEEIEREEIETRTKRKWRYRAIS